MKCILCEGELHDVICDELLSGSTKYDPNFYHASRVKKRICLTCGFVHQFAKKPQVFTDSKYKNINVDDV